MRTYSQTTDVELLSLLANDSEKAFTELYDRYWKRLFVVAIRRMHCLEDAEELVQDIFSALWRRHKQLTLTADLASYLAVSVKYRMIKTLDKCRLVFQLSREEGYAQKQIADKLQISAKTAEAHLSKAFKTLRTKLASFMMTLR